MGLVLAAVASVGLALTLDYLDQSFRTPSEVTAELGIPVLAAVPHHVRGQGGFGNGNGNGNGYGRGDHSQPVNDDETQSVRLG
jgi:hypothetical protein